MRSLRECLLDQVQAKLGAGDVAMAPVIALHENRAEPVCLLNLGRLLGLGVRAF